MIVIISGKLIFFSNICESDGESSYKSLLTVCSANEFTCFDGDDYDNSDDDGDDDRDDDGDDGAPSMH